MTHCWHELYLENSDVLDLELRLPDGGVGIGRLFLPCCDWLMATNHGICLLNA
jgi:hypothetical protein